MKMVNCLKKIAREGFIKQKNKKQSMRKTMNYNNKSINSFIISCVILFSSCSNNDCKKTYFPDGKLKMELCQQGGGNFFTKRTFSKSGNLIIEETVDKRGKKQGDFIEYFDNGGIKLEGKCIDDNLDGTLKMFYENGNIKQIAEYKNGKTNGTFKSYYGNSILELDAICENDITLYYKEYDSIGVVIKEYHGVKIQGIPSDTIKAGQTYKARITLVGPIDKSQKIDISTLLEGRIGSSVRQAMVVTNQVVVYESPTLDLTKRYVLNVFYSIGNKDSTWIKHDFYVY